MERDKYVELMTCLQAKPTNVGGFRECIGKGGFGIESEGENKFLINGVADRNVAKIIARTWLDLKYKQPVTRGILDKKDVDGFEVKLSFGHKFQNKKIVVLFRFVE